MSKKLIEQDFISAAKKLRCEIASVKAVAEIESRGNGFYADGFPTLLFERHVFRKYTQGRYNKSHPHLSGPQGNYGAAGQNQRNKFNEAFALNPAAAMMACSWGKFQLMGFNHAVCGFATIDEFVDAMKESEGKHLFGFVNFVINNNLADELRAKNWAKFAKGYNGAGYKKNNYDVKLAAAYRKYAAQKVSATVPALINQPAETDNSAEIPSVLTPETNEQPPNESNAVETAEIQTETQTATVTTTKNEQSVHESADVTEPKPQGVFAKLTAGIGALFSGTFIYTVFEKFGDFTISNTVLILIIVAIILAFLGFCFWAWLDAVKANNRVKIEAEAKTNINKKDVNWV